MSDFGKAVEAVIHRRKPEQIRAIAVTSGSKFIKARVSGASGTIRVRVPDGMIVNVGNIVLVTEYQKNEYTIITKL